MYNNKRSVMGKRKRILIAAALTASMILALPVWNVGRAEAAPGDESKKLNLAAESCSLTVTRAATTQEGDLVVDLYKIAKADDTETKGYEAYKLTAIVPYTGIQGTLNSVMEIKKKADGTFEASNNNENDVNEDYRNLAQTVAGTALELKDSEKKDNDGNPIKELKNKPTASIKLSETNKFSNLDPGMYLVVAHGDMLPEQYIRKINAELGEVKAPDYYKEGDGEYVTVATSNGYVYSYLPELIALPMRAPTGADSTGTAVWGSFATSGSDPWQSNVTVTLKSEADHEMASLTINKTFTGYENALITEGDGCVYRIIATLPGQTEPVFRDVVLINFIGEGTGTYRLENKIPIGAMVSVEEVSTGAGFDIVGALSPEVTWNGTEYTVSFENSYNEKVTAGGIVVNHFENGETGWNWTSTPEMVRPQ